MRAERHFLEAVSIRPESVDSVTADDPEERSGSVMDEPISPELVLVDPDLRSLLFSSEPISGSRFPGPTLVSVPAETADSLLTLRLAGRSLSIRRGWVGLALAGLCGSIVTIGVGLAIAAGPFDSANDRSEAAAGKTKAAAGKTKTTAGKTKTTADKTKAATVTGAQALPVIAKPNQGQDGASTRSVTTTPSRPTNQSRSPTPAAASPRRFAWAPAPGATSYEVAIYKADVRVFRARTTTASIVIPERTQRTGSSPLLGPGTYQWYVWPVRHGRRDSVALVRSTLVVPAP
jgi:hypothetical protein